MIFDNVSDIVRRRMARIRKTGSKPEARVRSIAHRLGYRFRKNRRDLPGTPDIVFPSRRKVIRVHGCFWHQHPGCRLAKTPTARPDYWLPKLSGNVARDAQNEVTLRELGWEGLTLWECQIASEAHVAAALRAFLGPPGPVTGISPAPGRTRP